MSPNKIKRNYWLGFHVANLRFQRKIKRFVLTSPQSISNGQRNNGIWFTFVMNLNSTCFISDGKRFVRILWNLERSVMVLGMISSVGVGPIVRLHADINSSVYKELLCQHAPLHLRKGTVETPIFIQYNAPCLKAKTVKFSWRGRNSCHEVAITKPRYESSRECMENHGRETSKQNSSKYWWFMGFLIEEWESITITFCKKLIGWFSRRCNEII